MSYELVGWRVSGMVEQSIRLRREKHKEHCYAGQGKQKASGFSGSCRIRRDKKRKTGKREKRKSRVASEV